MPLPLPAALLDQTPYVLSLSGKAARGGAADALAALDLKMGDMAVLAVLDEGGPAAQRVLAERLRLHPSDIVRVLDGLEARDLIKRAADPGDRRRHLVSATPAGVRMLAAAVRACEAASAALLAPLSASEQVALHGLLTKVLGAADDRGPG